LHCLSLESKKPVPYTLIRVPPSVVPLSGSILSIKRSIEGLNMGSKVVITVEFEGQWESCELLPIDAYIDFVKDGFEVLEFKYW
jgi:hypothetical protein